MTEDLPAERIALAAFQKEARRTENEKSAVIALAAVLTVTVNRAISQEKPEVQLRRAHPQRVYPSRIVTAPDMGMTMANHALIGVRVAVIEWEFNTEVVAVNVDHRVRDICQSAAFDKIAVIAKAAPEAHRKSLALIYALRAVSTRYAGDELHLTIMYPSPESAFSAPVHLAAVVRQGD